MKRTGNRRDLNYRRAVFVYESARLAAIAANAPIIPAPWEKREADFIEQFLGVIETQCGPMRSTSSEELHGSWVQAYLDNGWKYGKRYDAAAREFGQGLTEGLRPKKKRRKR